MVDFVTNDDIMAELKALRLAFPGEDLEGHRRFHEEVIEDMISRRSLRKAVIEQVVKGSVWALLITFGAAMWAYIKDHIK